MDIEVTKTKENPLLERQEVEVLIKHDSASTPKRADLLVELASKLKTDQDLLIVETIKTEKGKAHSKGRVFVYDKKESVPKDKLEKMQNRISGKKKEASAPAPKAKKE